MSDNPLHPLPQKVFQQAFHAYMRSRRGEYWRSETDPLVLRCLRQGFRAGWKAREKAGTNGQ